MNNEILDLPGYVYVYHAVGTPFYKIGFSAKPNDRKTKIQADCPYKLQPILCIPSLHPVKIEKFLHKHFDAKRGDGGGEWFKLTELDLSELVSFAIKTNSLESLTESIKKEALSAQELQQVIDCSQKTLEVTNFLLASKAMEDFTRKIVYGVATKEDAQKTFDIVKDIPKWKEATLERLYEFVEATSSKP